MDTGYNPSSAASHPAPCLWPGKAVKDSPKPWDPAPTVWETWKSSWLRISMAPAFVVTCRVKQQTGNISLSLLSLYVSDFAIKINKYFFKKKETELFYPTAHYAGG